MIKKGFIGFWLLILFILEWGFDVIEKVVEVVHTGVKELAVAVETLYNDKNESDSGKDK